MKTFDEQFNDILTEKFLVDEKDIKDVSMFLVDLQFYLEEMARFIKEIEFKFEIKIKSDEVKNFLTIQEAKKCIKHKLKFYNNNNLN